MKSSPPTRHNSAFTLVELLIVVGIIGVLMAILLPVVGRVREDAKRIQCLSHLESIGHAFMLYVSDNDGWLPAPASYSSILPDDWIYWENNRNLERSAVGKYLGQPVTPEIFRCPSDNIERRGGTIKFGGYRYSYSMNANLVLNKHGMHLAKVKNPSSKVLLFEEDDQTIDDGFGTLPNDSGINLLAIRHDTQIRKPETRTTGMTLNPNRRGNVAFCDGHADYMARKEVHVQAAYDPNY